MNEKDAPVQVGDWVMFLRDNRLEIAIVQLVRYHARAASYLWDIYTDKGLLCELAVIESRRGA